MFDYYLTFEQQLARIQLILFMLAMGATLSWKDFAPVFRLPRSLLYGLCMVLIISPLLAVGYALLTQISVGAAVGLILVATLPGGTFSNVYTYFGKGDVALSIAMSAGGAFLAILTIPLMLGLLASGQIPNFQMPMGEIILEILACVIGPVLLGMYLATQAGDHRNTMIRWLVRVGLFFVVLMVLGSLGSGRIQLKGKFLLSLKIVIFSVLMQQICTLPIRMLRWSTQTFVAVAMEVTVRNVYLGILLATLIFPTSSGMGGEVMFVVLFYGAVMLFTGFPAALRTRRAIRKKPDTVTTTNRPAVSPPHADAHFTRASLT